MEKTRTDAVTVTVGETTARYPADTALGTIAADFQKDYPYDIVLASVDGVLRELHHTVREDCRVSFMTRADGPGHATYCRSCSMLFLAALYQTAGYRRDLRAILHFSLGDGYYYTVEGYDLTEESIHLIEEHMRVMVDRCLPFMKRSVNTAEAAALFGRHHLKDKELLFRTRLSSRVNIYNLGEYEDYNYGYMVPHTGCLRLFRLVPYEGGVILQMPGRRQPDVLKPVLDSEQFFRTQLLGEKAAEEMGIPTLGYLNSRIIRQDTRSMILTAEALQESRLTELADDIASRQDVKFVMIAGPSSSGKTTFSQRLIIQLMARGLKPHYVGVDNYFVEREETPLLPNGQKDFESLRAIDVPLFNRHMTELLEGKAVVLPQFDFVEGKKFYKGAPMKLGPKDILVIEGIHCLNDDLSYSLPKESKYRVYISALTQLNVDEHNRIPSADGRLLRRIVRDNRTRGYNAARTLNLWPNVRAGEEENIFPYQESADFVFNTALPYELAILKQYVQPLLFQVEKEDPMYFEARRLLKFLDYIIGLPSEDVPANSILREFIGGGCFHL